jgi:hypothetical protein
MKKVLISIIAICLITLHTKAQTATDSVKTCIETFFKAMKMGDSTLLKNTLHEKAIFRTIVQKGTTTKIAEENVQGFITAIGTPHKDVYDERITFEHIHIDGALANVWTPYTFYIGETYSHKGTNNFVLTKTNNIWKILFVIDTRYK